VAAVFDGAGPYEGFPEQTVNGSLRCAHDVTAEDSMTVLGARTTTALPDEQLALVSEPEDHSVAPPPAAAAALYPPSFELDPEWERQVAAYVEIGIPHALGLTRDEYISSIPRLVPPPAEYVGRFDVPILVETRLSWRRIADLAGIETTIADRGFKFTARDERSQGPAEPYSGWFNQWGRRFVNPIAPLDAFKELGDDEIGASVHDLIAMEIAHRQLSSNARYFEAIGYRSLLRDPALEVLPERVARAPMINRTRRDVAQVSNNLHPIAYVTFRPLVRGRSIRGANSTPG
jgi:hypothetical protein